MKVLTAILALVALTTALPPHGKPVPTLRAPGSRIINGEQARDDQFPWQVAVYLNTDDGQHFCGGSLISTRWVLTAGHCVDGAHSWEIHLGLTNLGDGGTVRNTTRGIVNPTWNPLTISNDIAVIDLLEEVTLSDVIQPIRLDEDGLSAGTNVTVSGWGKTSDASTVVSQTLNFVNLTTIANLECQGYYGNLNPGVVCANGPNGKSTCNGDSGGPLIIGSGADALQVAVVSFVSSAGCASGAPSGYTRTATYRSWIREVTGV